MSCTIKVLTFLSHELLNRYYKLYAWTYAVTGSFASLVMVNSSWTKAHIESLWSTAQQRIVTVYPPCDTVVFQQLAAGNRQKMILSVGQFRPEKDHMLQLKSFHRYLQSHGSSNHAVDKLMQNLSCCEGPVHVLLQAIMV